MSLNLSNNKLYRLDDLSNVVQKAPNLKILNLSGNEVRWRAWLCSEGGVGGQRVLTAGDRGRAFQSRGGLRGAGGHEWGSSWLPTRLFPPPLQLKSERELDKIKGLKLEELWLDGNTLCDTFRDQSTYIRSVVASVSPPGDLHPPGG